MPDWTRSMEQSFDYYVVDPSTWGDDRLITTVTNCTITRDLGNETLGSATLDADEELNDMYVRPYLVTLQDRIKEKFCLGTFLCQTADMSYDGKRQFRSYDCYTPLIEMKENPMEIGYSIVKNENLLQRAIAIVEESVRAPVIPTSDTSDKMRLEKNFVSELSDTRLTFVSDLLAIGKYSLGLDEMGRIIFQPYQELAALRPVYEFNDGNSSILYPEIKIRGELFDIPNVVDVVYSSQTSKKTLRSTKVNDDPNSPVSTVARGRRITFRDTNPSVGDDTTQGILDLYAENLLKEKSTIEYTLTYSHGYCPVRLGDCVRLAYSRAGIKDTNAKVIRQVIHCTPGCKVEETSVFTEKLWR